jgi:hypothetical protein
MRCATLFRGAGLALRVVTVASLAAVMAGCGNPPERSQAGSRDHLLGWFKLPGHNDKREVISGHDTLIPVFKRDETYYSVCRGFEIPFKECVEGLEWAFTPSGMAGTKIGWDKASKTHYLVVRDSLASSSSDDRYGSGEKEPLTRIEKPPQLLDAEARPPRNHDDFLGWYQLVWTPGVRIEIRKDGNRFICQDHEFHPPGLWTTVRGPNELMPLPDQPGFTGFERDKDCRLVYSESLKRFEFVMTVKGMTPSVIRMPLARISAPASSESSKPPQPAVRIGIPSWT